MTDVAEPAGTIRGRVEAWPGSQDAGLPPGRMVRVYLPPGYRRGSRVYPSVWFQDGQHVFSGTRAATWGADLTLDTLIASGRIPPLVAVAVDNSGPDRASEYSHVRAFPRQPGARVDGLAYERLLVGSLMPAVSADLGLDPRPDRTAIIGSSLGGLVSYHIANRRPDVFGLLGMLSPYLSHLDPQTGVETEVFTRFDRPGPRRVWLDVGGMEATLTVAQVQRLREYLVGLGYQLGADLRWHVDPAAAHNETAWAARLPSVLLHLFGDPGQACLLRWSQQPEVAVGDLPADVAPWATYANGMQDTALHASLTVTDGHDLLSIPEPGRAVAKAEGSATLQATLDGAMASTTMRAADLPRQVSLDVEVRAGADAGASSLTFSWLPLARDADGVFRGHFRLPRGLGLDGSLSRDTDGAQAADDRGLPLREPVRLEQDTRLQISVSGWIPPEDAAYIPWGPSDPLGSVNPEEEVQ